MSDPECVFIHSDDDGDYWTGVDLESAKRLYENGAVSRYYVFGPTAADRIAALQAEKSALRAILDERERDLFNLRKNSEQMVLALHQEGTTFKARADSAADRIAALEAQLAAAEARLAELTGGAMVQRVEQAIAAAWPGAFQSHRIKALARDLLTRAGIIGGDND